MRFRINGHSYTWHPMVLARNLLTLALTVSAFALPAFLGYAFFCICLGIEVM